MAAIATIADIYYKDIFSKSGSEESIFKICFKGDYYEKEIL